jgi:hypothetical protein
MEKDTHGVHLSTSADHNLKWQLSRAPSKLGAKVRASRVFLCKKSGDKQHPFAKGFNNTPEMTPASLLID